MDVALGLTVLGVSIVAYATMNSVEIAVVSANRIRMRHLAEGGSKAAEAAERLHGQQDRFFAAVILLQNVSLYATARSYKVLGLTGGQSKIASPSAYSYVPFGSRRSVVVHA